MVTPTHPSGPVDQDEVVVLGAGLAGSFAARALADNGWPVRVIDRQPVGTDGPASYASRVALLQPKISDRGDRPGQWLRDGAARARALIQARWADDPRVAWRRCGALHVAHDDRSRRRLTRYLEQFGGEGGLRWIEADQTEAELGVALRHPGLLLESTGIARPAGLCAALLDHPRITAAGGHQVKALHQTDRGWRLAFADGESIEATRVVLANAMGARSLRPAAHLDLRPVRGQVTRVPEAQLHAALHLDPREHVRRAICYGGYLMPAVDGHYTLGASFVPGDHATDWREAEHRGVLARFDAMMKTPPDWRANAADPTGWAGVRCTTPTRLPYAGPVERDGQRLPGLYASLGHGSHGIASAARSAQHIVETIA